MATDIRTFGATMNGTTNDAAALQSAATNGSGEIDISGGTLLMNTDVTFDNPNVSFIGNGTVKTTTGKVVNIKRFGYINDLTFNAIKLVVPANGDIRTSSLNRTKHLGLTGLGTYIWFTNSGNTFAQMRGFVIDGATFTDMYQAIHGHIEGITVKNFTAQGWTYDYARFFSGTGVDNIFEDGVINGDDLNCCEGIMFYTNPTDFPLKAIKNNTIRRIKNYNIREESISFDAYANSAAYGGSIIRGTIGQINGSIISVNYAAQMVSPERPGETPYAGTYVGLYLAWINGANEGELYEITGHSGSNITIAGYTGGGSAGDTVYVAQPFIGNQIYDNEIYLSYTSPSGPRFAVHVGISMWMGCYDNYIARNKVYRSRYAVSMANCTIDAGGGVYGGGRNVFEDNYFEDCERIWCKLRDYMPSMTPKPRFVDQIYLRNTAVNPNTAAIDGLVIDYHLDPTFGDNSFPTITGLTNNTPTLTAEDINRDTAPTLTKPTASRVGQNIQAASQIANYVAATDTVGAFYRDSTASTQGGTIKPDTLGQTIWLPMNDSLTQVGDDWTAVEAVIDTTPDSVVGIVGVERDGVWYWSVESDALEVRYPTFTTPGSYAVRAYEAYVEMHPAGVLGSFSIRAYDIVPDLVIDVGSFAIRAYEPSFGDIVELLASLIYMRGVDEILLSPADMYIYQLASDIIEQYPNETIVAYITPSFSAPTYEEKNVYVKTADHIELIIL